MPYQTEMINCRYCGEPFLRRVPCRRLCSRECAVAWANLIRRRSYQSRLRPEPGPHPPNLPGEKWRAVPGYEGRYEVSNHGRVKSLPRPKVHNPRLLKTSPDVCGYPVVRFWSSDATPRGWRVHELVLLAFVGPRPDWAAHIRHLDGNKLNNVLRNLAYGTAAENAQDAIRHGANRLAAQTHCLRGHPFNEANTRRIPSRPNSRYCRACQDRTRDERRARQRAAGLPVT